MKSIIFSGPMIRALLAGRKTQTRRPADIDLPQADAAIVMRGDDGCSVHIPGVGYGPIVECPYGGPGDRLYVREGIRLSGPARKGRGIAEYCADAAPLPFLDEWPWKSRQLSPIHMPRGVHRIQIVILEVRVERIQAISVEDAIAEGAFKMPHDPAYPGYPGSEPRWTMGEATGYAQCLGSPQMALANLFNVLHAGPNWNLKPGPSPFDKDPFVWVLRFRVELRDEYRSAEGDEEGDGTSPRSLSGVLDGGGPP